MVEKPEGRKQPEEIEAGQKFGVRIIIKEVIHYLFIFISKNEKKDVPELLIEVNVII